MLSGINEMEPPYNNITFRKRKHKRLNKIHSELPHGQNNCAENDLYTGTGFNFEINKNEEEKLGKKHIMRKNSNYCPVDPSTKGENDCKRYEKNPPVVTDSCSRLYNMTPYLGSEDYVKIVSDKEERMPTDSMELKESGEQMLTNEGWKSKHIKECTEFVKVINSNINYTDHIQTCDMQGQNVKIHKKKRKLYDLQTAMASKTSEAICCENNGVKECYVDNILVYPKNKLKNLDNSDLEIASSEICLPSKQNLYEINSDSGIDMQKKLKFKKVSTKRCNKNKLNDTMVAVLLPLVKSKHSKDFKNDVELTDIFLNENGDCIGPETKTNSLVISPKIDNLCHGDKNGSTVDIIESKHKKLLQRRKCDQSTEGCLKRKEIASLYETSTKNSDPVEESCSKQETLHKAERQIYLSKSENVVEFDSDSCSHLFGKVKKKRKHKNKIENSNLCAQDTEEFESANCSDFPNKKNKGRLGEIKLLQKGKNYGSVYCPDLSFTENVKKKKHKNKLQDSEQGRAEGFTDLYTHEIKKKKKYKHEFDEIKDKLLTQALEKFRPEYVEHTDKTAHINKKGNEILGSNKSTAEKNKFVNILRDQKKQLHTAPRKHKNDNKDLENLRAALLSSALKSIGYKKSESNDIHVDCKKSLDSGGKNETNQSSCNKERKHKEEERGKVKEKDTYKSAHDMNKKSSNTHYSEGDVRKALITAALKRIKRNEQKQKNKMSLKACSDHEVKPKHKNKRKSKVEKNMEKKNNINEMESMRSFLISAALAKMNDNNDINKTSNVNNKNEKVES